MMMKNNDDGVGKKVIIRMHRMSAHSKLSQIQNLNQQRCSNLPKLESITDIQLFHEIFIVQLMQSGILLSLKVNLNPQKCAQ